MTEATKLTMESALGYEGFSASATVVGLERLKLAHAIVTIAHTTNHCGDGYSRLSDIALKVMEEILPMACSIAGRQVFITVQHPPQ